MCKGCAIKSIGGGIYNCKKHGHKYITWKCYLCCSEALFRCGNSYLCELHHEGIKPWGSVEHCPGPDRCPLKIPHPPNSADPINSMYPLGCSLCRKTDNIDALQVIEEVKLGEQKVMFNNMQQKA